MFGAKQLSLNRDTESVVALTPNIKLGFRLLALGSQKTLSSRIISERLEPSAGFFGGADRDRTGGLLVANQALSQLSYSPFLAVSHQPSAIRKPDFPDD